MVTESERIAKNAYQRAWRQRNREACRATDKRWRLANPDKHKDMRKSYRERIRREVIEKYGGACVRCGIDDWPLLVFDHINDDGHELRGKVHPQGGAQFAMWLRKNDYPEGIVQVLCHNCNALKQHHPESFHG